MDQPLLWLPTSAGGEQTRAGLHSGFKRVRGHTGPLLFPEVGLCHWQSPRWKKQTSHLSFQGLPQFTAFFSSWRRGKKNPLPAALALFLSPCAQRGARLPHRSRPAIPDSLPICAHHMSITL